MTINNSIKALPENILKMFTKSEFQQAIDSLFASGELIPHDNIYFPKAADIFDRGSIEHHFEGTVDIVNMDDLIVQATITGSIQLTIHTNSDDVEMHGPYDVEVVLNKIENVLVMTHGQSKVETVESLSLLEVTLEQLIRNQIA